MKVTTKLIGLISGLFLLCCMSAIYVDNIGFRSTTGIFEEKVKEKLELQVSNAMDKMDRMFFERYKDMQFMAGDQVISSTASTPEQLSERLKEFLKMNQFYQSLAFFNLKRTRIADTSGTNIGKQHAFTEYWPGIAEGRDFVLLMAMSETIKEVVLYFAHVVKDKKSRPIGVVVSHISVDSLYEIVRQAAGIQPTEKELMIELVNKKGLILYSNYEKKEILKGFSHDWESIKGLVSQKKLAGSTRHYHEGKDEIAAFAQEQGYLDFKGNAWILIICTPSEKVFADIREHRNKFLVIYSAIGFMALLSIIFISRAVTKPLQELSMAAAEIGRGNLDIHMEVKSEDEIGQLARAFNGMADKLNNSFSELITKEDALKAANINLDAANKELESFAYVVSHDLKAPLRAISSLSNWLAADYADKLDEQGRESLGLLVQRAKRMNSLIDGILHYSRIGRVKDEMKLVDLDTVVKDVIDLVAPPGQIAVTIETKLPTLLCEKTRIYQVFQNLISNAVKHLDKPKGDIRIGCLAADSDSSECGFRSSEIKPSSSSELKTIPHSALRTPHSKDDYWTFYVSDNGPGIEEQYFDKIFQMFQTLKPRDEVENTGVGLTIVKKIVEMYGGRIWVESKVGEGSTFWFTVKRQESDREA